MTLPKTSPTWTNVALVVLALASLFLAIFGTVRAMGANDQVVVDHERRIILLEQKFERMMEKQGEMVGDIKVIRTYVENSKEKNQ
jgi:hypothetical protein